MNNDPFSPISSIVQKEQRSTSYSSKFLGYYICSFDTTYGLQILYSSPLNLRKNLEEANILKAHYIWKIKHIPTRIDLTFSEFVYSAFQLHESKHYDVQATADNPLYGVVFKLWKGEEPVPSYTLIELRNDLQEHYWREINLLYKYQALALNPVRRREYKQLSPQIHKIESEMQSLWEEFQNKVTKVKVTIHPQEKDLPETSIFPTKRDVDIPDLFKDKITMRIAKPSETSDEILVILTNKRELLDDVTIRVAHVSDFFSENLWEQFLNVWPTKEEIILEFSRTLNAEKYQIKIISKGRTVTIKTIEIDFIEY